MYFKNRQQAGVVLANTLFSKFKNKKPIVVAIPRGGVPVAEPIANLFDAPLTIIASKKIGAPSNPEYGIGAVSEDGQIWMDYQSIGTTNFDQSEIDQSVEDAISEMKRQTNVFRHALRPVEFRGSSVILVDDGLATGATMLAAIRSLKARGVKEIVVAVPVASEEAVTLIKAEATQVISAYTPQFFMAVGKWYDDFTQVTDDEVINLLMSSNFKSNQESKSKEVVIDTDRIRLNGDLTEPKNCKAWIIFAHGSGSSRKSPRNIEVAKSLNDAGFGTFLFDLLTEEESRVRSNVFDIDLLAKRLQLATHWLRGRPEWKRKPIGYFGASTGAGAALQACALYEPNIFAVVSRGGRPDLAKELIQVKCPTLLIVGGDDGQVIDLNEFANKQIPTSKMVIIPHAGHLFEEPGTLEKVMITAREWFEIQLKSFRGERHAVA
jgi:putative phosphoribosyl transferase